MLLVLLLLLILLLLLLLLILLVLLILLLVVVAAALILQLTLTQHQVIARLIIIGIAAQRVLVGLDSLTEILHALIGHALIMISLRLTQRIRLSLRSAFKHHCHRVATFLLHQFVVLRKHRRGEVVLHARIRTVGTVGLQVVHLSLLTLVGPVERVTLADQFAGLTVICIR